MTGTRIDPADSPFVRLRPFEVVAVLVVIWSVAIVVAYVAFQQGRITLLPVYAAFVLYLTMFSLPVVMPGRDSGIFNPVVFAILCHGMMMLLRAHAPLAAGLLQSHRAVPHASQAALDAAVAKSFVLEAIALASLYAGYSLMPYLRFRKLPPFRPKALRLKVVLWVALSVLAILVLASKLGSIGGLLLQRGLPQGDRLRAEIGAHWHLVAGIGTVAPVIWAAIRPQALRTLLYWAVTLTSVLCLYAARGSRSHVLIVLITIGMTWTLHARKIPYKVIIAGALFSIVMLGALGQFREATRQQTDVTEVEVETDVGEAFESGVETLSTRGVHDNGQIAVIARVPHEVGYLWGRSYLSIPFVALPSALIGTKPFTAGRLNALLVHERDNTGIPAGTVGEAYWNFSYAGPVLVFLLYGAVLKVIAGVYLRNHDNPAVLALYVFVLYRFRPGSDPIYDFTHALVPGLLFLLFLAFPFGSARQRRRVRRAPADLQPGLSGARVT